MKNLSPILDGALPRSEALNQKRNKSRPEHRGPGTRRKLVHPGHLASLGIIVSITGMGLYEVARIGFCVFLAMYGFNLVLLCAGWCREALREVARQSRLPARGLRMETIRRPASRGIKLAHGPSTEVRAAR